MYYVIPNHVSICDCGKGHLPEAQPFHTFGEAQKKANEAIQATAKENGYGYVFERDVLIVAPPGDDILPLVAKKLGVKVPAANPPAAAPAKPTN